MQGFDGQLSEKLTSICLTISSSVVEPELFIRLLIHFSPDFGSGLAIPRIGPLKNVQLNSSII